uniref:Crossover junction endonuclease MUS81-like HHH domain-containing protein n=1 Tax=Oncorhynchus kisutch TaxID=8019 RepID=A0A8C7MKU7_ONCKI
MDCDRALRLLKVDRLPSGVYLLKLLDTAVYSLLNPDKDIETTKDGVKEDILNKIPLPATQDMNIIAYSDDFKDEYGVSQSDLEALISGLHPKDETPSNATATSDPQQKPLSGKWVCAQSSQSKVDNHNKHITDKLEVLAKAYTHQGDRWRALGYSKAVNPLKSYHKPITSYEVGYLVPYLHSW